MERAKRIREATLGIAHEQTLEARQLCEELETIITAPPPAPPLPQFKSTPQPTPEVPQKPKTAMKPRPLLRGSSGPPPPPPLPPAADVTLPKHVPRATRNGQAVCNDVIDEIKGLRLQKGQMYDRSDARQQLESMIGARKRKIKLKKLK